MSNKKHNLKSNFIYQAFYELLLVILPILTSPYVSRILGASNIGIYSYTYTVAYYFTLISALGIKNYGNREISKCRDDKEKLNKTFSSILFLHLFISLIVISAYIIFCIAIDDKYKIYYAIQSFYLIGALFDISWLFFGLELFKTTVTRNIFIKISSVALIFIFVKNEGDLWKYVLIMAVSSFLSQLYLWFKIKPLVKIVKVSKSEIFRHLPQMLILFIPTIAVSFYNYMDKVMLGAMSGTTELGFYENAFKITTVCSSLIGSVGTVMLPRMSNMIATGDRDTSKKYINMSMTCVAFMACAMAFGIAAVSSDFAPVFWGKEFSKCGSLLALLAIYLPIQGFASVLRTQFLIPHSWDKQYTFSLCIGAIVNVAVNYLLIPCYQSVGAVIGTIFAEAAVCIAQTIVVRHELPIKEYIKNSMPFIINGIAMFIIVRLLELFITTTVLTLIIQIIVGACIYISLCLIYLRLSNNEVYKILLKSIKL